MADGVHETAMELTAKVPCPTCGLETGVDAQGRCAECGQMRSCRDDPLTWVRHPFLSLPAMRYQRAYVWLVAVSTLDIVLTWLVLTVWGGHEINPIAGAVIEQMGFVGATGLKFAAMLGAVIACEVVGRRDDRYGRGLSVAAVCINSFPVIYTIVLLLTHGAASSTGAVDPLMHAFGASRGG